MLSSGKPVISTVWPACDINLGVSEYLLYQCDTPRRPPTTAKAESGFFQKIPESSHQHNDISVLRQISLYVRVHAEPGIHDVLVSTNKFQAYGDLRL